MERIKNFFNDESGAAAVEYGLLVGLIACVIILAVSTSGRQHLRQVRCCCCCTACSDLILRARLHGAAPWRAQAPRIWQPDRKFKNPQVRYLMRPARLVLMTG